MYAHDIEQLKKKLDSIERVLIDIQREQGHGYIPKQNTNLAVKVISGSDEAVLSTLISLDANGYPRISHDARIIWDNGDWITVLEWLWGPILVGTISEDGTMLNEIGSDRTFHLNEHSYSSGETVLMTRDTDNGGFHVFK